MESLTICHGNDEKDHRRRDREANPETKAWHRSPERSAEIGSLARLEERDAPTGPIMQAIICPGQSEGNFAGQMPPRLDQADQWRFEAPGDREPARIGAQRDRACSA